MADSRPHPDPTAELEKVRRHLRILVDIGRLAAEGSSVQAFLERMVAQVARAVEIEHVKVLRYRPASADLLIVAGLGWKDGVVGSVALSSDLRSPPGRAYRTAQPVTIGCLAAQSEYDAAPVLVEHGIVSVSNVPIMIAGAAWGVLEVDSTVQRDFNQDTTEFLTAAGALVGGFVQRHEQVPGEAARLAAAAAEAQHQDVLLRELQHRVKNNFQLLLASLTQQKRRHTSAEVQGVLDHVTGRINAISLAHDQLTLRTGGQIVRLSDYLRALCASLQQQADVEFQVTADELELSVDRAVPLGLILNEVATNSIKHAFHEVENPRIEVRLDGGIGYGEARLTMADNGRGVDKERPMGSGLNLVRSLARQIGGVLEQDSSPRGTVTVLTFPLIG